MGKIEFRDVFKKYDEDMVVKDFNLIVNSQEFIVILGPSGCGKTTVLRMLAGLEKISEGSLYLDGILSNEKTPKDRGIAMVFQNYSLFPNMNVYDNIAFGLAMKRCDNKTMDDKVQEMASMLNLTPFLKRKPRKLSGGEKQRVAIARALAVEKEILLLDEPLASIDAELKTHMRKEITNLTKKLKITCLCVTHDQDDAMMMADRIVIMNQGVIQQIGTPEEIYSNPANRFVGNFIGIMNFIEGEVKDGFFVKEGLKIKAPQGYHKLTLGFRPEDIIEGEIKANVTKTVSLGNETLRYIEVWNQELIQKDYLNHQPLIEINIGLAKYYFFDNEGKRITT